MKHVEKIRVYPSKTAWTLNSEEIWGYMLEPAGSSIKQQYRTAFCELKHTRSSYKPRIYVDSGKPFDDSSEVFQGKDLTIAVGSDKVRGGSSSVWEEGMKRTEPQRERDGGDSSLTTTDSSTTVSNSNTAQPSAS